VWKTDNGNIIGIYPEAVDKLKKDFATSVNNPNKINLTFYLAIEELEIEGKIILYIFIPESSQVHRCNGRIYDRN
jgi:ATP-dependent DNA helicase RecG